MFGGRTEATQPGDDTSVNTVSPSIDAPSDPAPAAAAPPVMDSPAFLPAPTDADVAAPAAPSASAPVVAAASDDDLLGIKQQALQQLSPLVGHLDQTPEDKFRTTMMMIQASDNQALIKDAYAAAGQISDEKVRAQALLDIINEINYFTQQGQNNTTSTDSVS
ncbi:MAG TPA: hypothetical protein VLF43_01615 [Candidatus Saccharimonadales bacterium]|nr:hypothetical protein [Candidatus Saccharimonadales bacterium]